MNQAPITSKKESRPKKTLPSSWYHDPAIYEQERQKIFKSQWLLYSHESLFLHPGDYVAQCIAGYPVFVIRTNEGELKAFHNVCRHRAAPLLKTGIGKVATLRCPYHGWVYDTEGQLRKAPDFGGNEKALCDRTSLFTIHVKSWHGLIFICLAQSPPDFEESLGSLISSASDTDLSSFKYHSHDGHELNCNWKTYVENYLEGYHISYVHPSLHKEIDIQKYRVTAHEKIALHQSAPRDGQEETAINDGLWVWHWPYAALNIYKTGMNLELMIPTGPQTMILEYYYLFHDQIDEDLIQKTISMSKEVTEEDIKICEPVQKNLNAGIYNTGELSQKHESGIAYFQDLVRNALNKP